MTVPNLKQTAKPVKPKINWARNEEADNFAKTVKLFRQGKYDEASFRRFRLQHGAYGTRMTNDYAMVRIKLPAGEIYPNQFEKISQLMDKGETVDLLITDMIMPVCNGIDLIDSINKKNFKIPIYVLTSFGDKELIIELMLKG